MREPDESSITVLHVNKDPLYIAHEYYTNIIYMRGFGSFCIQIYLKLRFSDRFLL